MHPLFGIRTDARLSLQCIKYFDQCSANLARNPNAQDNNFCLRAIGILKRHPLRSLRSSANSAEEPKCPCSTRPSGRFGILAIDLSIQPPIKSPRFVGEKILRRIRPLDSPRRAVIAT